MTTTTTRYVVAVAWKTDRNDAAARVCHVATAPEAEAALRSLVADRSEPVVATALFRVPKRWSSVAAMDNALRRLDTYRRRKA